MQPPPREGAWSALCGNLSKSGLDNYVVKRSELPLLEEVAWPGLPFPKLWNGSLAISKGVIKSF